MMNLKRSPLVLAMLLAFAASAYALPVCKMWINNPFEYLDLNRAVACPSTPYSWSVESNVAWGMSDQPRPDPAVCTYDRLFIASNSGICDTGAPSPIVGHESGCSNGMKYYKLTATYVSSYVNGVPTYSTGFQQSDAWCTGGCESPLIVALSPGGLPGNAFGDAAHGALFDLDGSGVPEYVATLGFNANAAWLVLDRNGNGKVEYTDLFGNYTEQAPVPDGNGFLALAVFDSNNDQKIDASDPVFSQLRLWRDVNRDWQNQPSEMLTIEQAGFRSFNLDFHEEGKKDGLGNLWRFSALATKINGSHTTIYDVYLNAIYSPDEVQ
jgi:hypothetical protein